MRTLAVLIATLMLATAMPVSANETVADANTAFFAEQIEALGVDATSDEATAAIAEAVARAGDVRLDLLAADAAPGDAAAVGDVWIIEFGAGSCPAPTVLAPGVPGSSAHPQARVYNGDIGTQSTTGFGFYVDWTTKSSGTYTTGVTIVGQSDFFCFEFFGIYIYFPFLTGAMTSN